MNRKLSISDIIAPILVIVIAIALLALFDLSFESDKQGEVQIALNMILVFVTTVYVIITNLILSDSKKSRAIDFKRLQLEKFYLPLHYALASFEGLKSLERGSLLPYTYLGEGEVPVLFEKYEYFIENGRLSDDEAAKLVQDLSANVEKDIGSLKKELKKLR